MTSVVTDSGCPYIVRQDPREFDPGAPLSQFQMKKLVCGSVGPTPSDLVTCLPAGLIGYSFASADSAALTTISFAIPFHLLSIASKTPEY